MTVLFENSLGEKREIGHAQNMTEVWGIIQHFVEAHHFKSYYTRYWRTDEGIKVDVGSHTEFFYIVEDD